MILFNGEVKRTFIEAFKPDINWINECYILLKKSSLFTLKITSISVANLKTFEILKRYFNGIAQFNIMDEVVDYVKKNSTKLLFPREEMLQLQANLAYYSNLQECVYLLIQLGDSYLSCEQLRKAHESFHLAADIIEEEEIDIDDIQELRMLIGLIKTSIWNTIRDKQKIERWIELAEKIIKVLVVDDIPYLQLKLKFFLLCYQFNHSLGNVKRALASAKEGIDLVEKYNMYRFDMSSCETIWRFYAIAIKEDTQSIEECLNVFETAKEKCKNTAKFMFGYIIHKNMNIVEQNPQK